MKGDQGDISVNNYEADCASGVVYGYIDTKCTSEAVEIQEVCLAAPNKKSRFGAHSLKVQCDVPSSSSEDESEL